MKSTSISSTKNIVVVGATGFVGRPLIAELKRQKWVVTTVGRSSGVANEDGINHVVADINQPLDPTIFNGAYAVVNLAGEPIYGFWSSAKKRRIYESRVMGTRHIAAALSKIDNPPKVLLNASAVGYYGDQGEQIVDEQTSYGNDFLARVCVDWETASRQAESSLTRVVIARNAVVLGNGGLLKTIKPYFKIGGGIWIDNGQQWIPWVHIDDVVRYYLELLNNPKASGAYNIVAGSSRGKIFFKAVGKSLHRPTLFGIPHQLLRLRYGGMAESIAISQRVITKRLVMDFQHTDLESALKQ